MLHRAAVNVDLHQWDQVSKPKRMFGLDVDCDERRKSAHIYDPVEPHEELLHGELWIYYYPLSCLQCLDHWPGVLVLLGAHRGDIGFDAASTETYSDHGCDQAAEACTTLDRRRCRGCNEDDEANNIDTGSYKYSFELPKILISHDGANDGGSISPEFEEIPERCRHSLTFSKRSRQIGSRSIRIARAC